MFLDIGNQFSIPFPPVWPQNQPMELLDKLFSETHRFRIQFQPNNGWTGLEPVTYPGMAESEFFFSYYVKGDRQGFSHAGTLSGKTSSIIDCVCRIFATSIFVFRAERHSNTQSPYADASALQSNASNLANVLNALQGRGRVKWGIFNDLVQSVLPNISEVMVSPEGQQFVIYLLHRGVPPDAADRCRIRASDSGTGVTQVLAMLALLVTASSSRVIVVDEPNTFLHPGAVRELMMILQTHATKHQFIMTTHAPGLISAARKAAAFVVRWRPWESTVQRIEAADVSALRELLLDVGVSLSDVFGAESIFWVEGPTEAVCFPMILQQFKIELPKGAVITPVINTGDFEKKRVPAQLVFDIYNRLSSSTGLLPPAVAFNFDREARTDRQIEDASVSSEGRAHFLPRRTFENFLIHPAALAALLNSMETFATNHVSDVVVSTWLSKWWAGNKDNRSSGQTPEKTFDPQDSDWVTMVDAPRMFINLVSELSETKEKYEKVYCGKWLTQWLIENDPSHLVPVANYLRGIFDDAHAKGLRQDKSISTAQGSSSN